jgi:hypothetical protein
VPLNRHATTTHEWYRLGREYVRIATNELQLAGLHSVTATAADGHATFRQSYQDWGIDRQVEYDNMTLLNDPGYMQVARETRQLRPA